MGTKTIGYENDGKWRAKVSIIAAAEVAKGSLGEAETKWAEQALQQATQSLQDHATPV